MPPSYFDLALRKTEREVHVESLPVVGRIPEWLAGTLIRNGPGTFEVGEERYRHWFDGLAMLHKFAFRDGRVAYANRFLDTRTYRAAMQAKRIAYSEFATDPTRTALERVKAVLNPDVSDSAKVSIARIAGHTMALAETPIQVLFDPETLDTAGTFVYEDGPLSGQMTTVHPQFDPATGAAYNLVVRYHAVSHYRLYRVDPDGTRTLVGQVPSMQPSYMHSFGMTQHYAIFTAFPLVVNPLNLLLWLKPYIENFRWEPRRGTPFYVLDRHTGALVGRYEADPFFAFHHVNAWEEGDELVMDIDAYEDASIIQAWYLDRMRDENTRLPFGRLRRYRLPLKGKRVTWELLSDECAELARFDQTRFTMDGSYRYVYASSINKAHHEGFYNQIIKIDLARGTSRAWYEPGCYPGEPVFVGRPGRSAEDDGVVLSVVLDVNQRTSFLLILDAASLDELARAAIPHPILFGYHGEFFA